MPNDDFDPPTNNEFTRKHSRLHALAMGIAILGTVAFAWGLWRISIERIEATRWVEHTHEVIAHIQATGVQVEAAETGQRGFLLTGRESYLGPYQAAPEKIHREIEIMVQLTQDNLSQQERLRRLRSVVDQKLGLMAESVRLRREQGQGAALALVMTDQGKQSMDEIRSILSGMQQEEERLLTIRHSADGKVSKLLYLVCGGILLVVFAAAGLIIWLLRWIGRLQTGLVTVCAWSRQVRHDGKWMNVDEYLRERFGLSITHGISEKAAAELNRQLKASQAPFP